MKNKNPFQTVSVITTGLIALYLLTEWRWMVYVALAFGLAGAFSPFLARWIDFLWMKMAWTLGLVVPKILLSLVFFLLLTPLAWLSRLFGPTDPLHLRNTQKSMFKQVQKSFEQTSFEKPW